jgi:hypothetical protein
MENKKCLKPPTSSKSIGFREEHPPFWKKKP